MDSGHGVHIARPFVGTNPVDVYQCLKAKNNEEETAVIKINQ